MTLPISTERLVLRRFTDGDVRDLLACVADASFANATPEIEATEAGVRRYIAMQNGLQPFERGRCFDLAVERRADGTVIGLVSMVRDEHEQAAIGYALGIDYRGERYATEAARGLIGFGFGSLGLRRIHADTHSDNTASWKVMERVGMTREGGVREATRGAGTSAGVVTYGMLATQWRELVAARDADGASTAAGVCL